MPVLDLLKSIHTHTSAAAADDDEIKEEKNCPSTNYYSSLV